MSKFLNPTDNVSYMPLKRHPAVTLYEEN